MVATWWTAWCAVTNSNPWTGSYWSPAQTRPRLLRGSLALRGAAGPRAGADAPRHAPPSRDRPFARRRRGPLASPSSGSPGPRARTGAPTPQGSALCGPTRRSAAGTPARTADGSSASWTLLSAPTMGCPRNRVNSRVPQHYPGDGLGPSPGTGAGDIYPPGVFSCLGQQTTRIKGYRPVETPDLPAEDRGTRIRMQPRSAQGRPATVRIHHDRVLVTRSPPEGSSLSPR